VHLTVRQLLDGGQEATTHRKAVDAKQISERLVARSGQDSLATHCGAIPDGIGRIGHPIDTAGIRALL